MKHRSPPPDGGLKEPQMPFANTFSGELVFLEECEKCWGIGSYPINPHHTCTLCGGTGRRLKR